MRPLDLGPDYPSFLQLPGEEAQPLIRERPWSREFGTAKTRAIISRFMDGSATISVSELTAAWTGWTDGERRDFMHNCEWLRHQSDFSEMMRFVVLHGEVSDWSGAAQSIAQALPPEEAFAILDEALDRTAVGARSNLLQALALLRHPRSPQVIRRELATIVTSPALWNDDPFLNWVAYDALCAVEYLLLLGANPTELEPLVRRLAAHPCKRNVDAVRRRLSAFYESIPPRE